MADTFTQLYVHLIFAVKGHESLIPSSWKDELYKYITVIVQKYKHKLLCINGMPDHVHIFISYHPTQLIPELVEEIKTSSNRWINSKKFVHGHFSWQGGYGAFSYSRSQRDDVVRYIVNQEVHHRKYSFKEEYMQLLQKFEVAYKDEYLFAFLNDVNKKQ